MLNVNGMIDLTMVYYAIKYNLAFKKTLSVLGDRKMTPSDASPPSM